MLLLGFGFIPLWALPSGSARFGDSSLTRILERHRWAVRISYRVNAANVRTSTLATGDELKIINNPESQQVQLYHQVSHKRPLGFRAARISEGRALFFCLSQLCTFFHTCHFLSRRRFSCHLHLLSSWLSFNLSLEGPLPIQNWEGTLEWNESFPGSQGCTSSLWVSVFSWPK